MRLLFYGAFVFIVGFIAAILGFFTSIFFTVRNFICDVFWWIIDLLRDIWAGICGIFQWIWDGICYLFIAVFEYIILPAFAFCLSPVTCSEQPAQQPENIPQALTESTLSLAPYHYEMPSGHYSLIPTEEMRHILQKQAELLQGIVPTAGGRTAPALPHRIDSEAGMLQLVMALTQEEWQLLKVRQLLRAIGTPQEKLPPYPTEEAVMKALFYAELPYRACHLIDTLMLKNDEDYGTLKPPCAQLRYLAAYTLGLMATQHYEPLHKKHWLYTVRRYHNLDTPILGKLKDISLRHPSVGVPNAEKEKGFSPVFYPAAVKKQGCTGTESGPRTRKPSSFHP